MSYQRVILTHIPRFPGITLLNRRTLTVGANQNVPTTAWPMLLFYIGGTIRLILVRFIDNRLLRRAATGYWLYISALFVFALVLSNVERWNVIATLVAFLVILFFILAGTLRIVGDVLGGVVNLFRIVGGQFRIALKYVALAAARVAKFLRMIVRNIKELYETYILAPFQRLYERIRKAQARIESKVDASLRTSGSTTNPRLAQLSDCV